jgi:hypothetical protein
LEYTVFKIKQNTEKTLSQDYEETNWIYKEILKKR